MCECVAFQGLFSVVDVQLSSDYLCVTLDREITHDKGVIDIITPCQSSKFYADRVSIFCMPIIALLR